jgi:hypothetical protein
MTPTESPRLAACPFGCPETAKRDIMLHGATGIWTVYCWGCGGEGPSVATSDEAPTRWNSRPPLPRIRGEDVLAAAIEARKHGDSPFTTAYTGYFVDALNTILAAREGEKV